MDDNGKKMSKSLGNVVDPDTVDDTFPYYFLTEEGTSNCKIYFSFFYDNKFLGDRRLAEWNARSRCGWAASVGGTRGGRDVGRIENRQESHRGY